MLREKARALQFQSVDELGVATVADITPLILDIYNHGMKTDAQTLLKRHRFFYTRADGPEVKLTKRAALDIAERFRKVHASRSVEAKRSFRCLDAELSVQVAARVGLTAFDVVGVVMEKMGEVLKSKALYVVRIPQDACDKATQCLIDHMQVTPLFREANSVHLELQIPRSGEALVWHLVNSLGFRPRGRAGGFTANPLTAFGLLPPYLAGLNLDYSDLLQKVINQKNVSHLQKIVFEKRITTADFILGLPIKCVYMWDRVLLCPLLDLPRF
jgi:hypothetical protein